MIFVMPLPLLFLRLMRALNALAVCGLLLFLTADQVLLNDMRPHEQRLHLPSVELGQHLVAHGIVILHTGL